MLHEEKNTVRITFHSYNLAKSHRSVRKRTVTVRGKYLKQEEQTLYGPDTAVISRLPPRVDDTSRVGAQLGNVAPSRRHQHT